LLPSLARAEKKKRKEYIFKKSPKGKNNHPIYENSPNLATLIPSHLFCFIGSRISQLAEALHLQDSR
jgi:hypothetical protein